jgi:hypothetical protein
MADGDAATASDNAQALALATLRQQLAERLIRYSFMIVGAVIFVVIALAIIGGILSANYMTTTWINAVQGAADKIMAAVLPLLGAWVGAIIAFYFGRENYDAAARNMQTAIKSTQPNPLASLAVSEHMVPTNKLMIATTNQEDPSLLRGVILKRFADLGLGRIIVVHDPKMSTPGQASAEAIGLGVVHESYVNRFILDQVDQGVAANSVTLGQLLADPAQAKALPSSVVFVSLSATLGDVRKKMDEASKALTTPVRDVFVTKTGAPNEPLLGYITDIDLAEKGALS